MKSIFRLFIRGGIPVSTPVNTETPVPVNPIPGKSVPLLFCLSILMAAMAAIVTEGILRLMKSVNTYCGLPGVYRDTDLYDPMILLVPVIITLVFALFLRYAGVAYEGWIRQFRSIVSINAGIPMGLEGALMDRSLEGAGRSKRDLGREKRILVGAAITGGIAFLFGSPLMAIALVVELLIVELSWISITATILGGGTGMLLHYWLIGSDPVFMMSEVLPASVPALLGYTATGILVGLIAVLATKMIRGMDGLFSKLPLDRVWWPVIAALVTGILGYIFPVLLGAGYEYIDDLLLGQVTLQLLVILIVGKLLLLGIVAGSGIPGGTIAPLLVSGAALGLFITFLLQLIFPSVQLNYSVAALAGMTALFAGGNRVLPAAIFFAIETTHVTNALLPVICACTAAYMIVFLLAKKKVAQPAVLPEKIC